MKEDETPPLDCREGAVTGTAYVGGSECTRTRNVYNDVDVACGLNEYRSVNDSLTWPPSRTAAEKGTGTPDGRVLDAQGRLVPLDGSKVFVENEIWVYMKGEIGHSKAEVLSINAHVALLNKCNNRSERQCQELKASVTTLRERPSMGQLITSCLCSGQTAIFVSWRIMMLNCIVSSKIKAFK